MFFSEKLFLVFGLEKKNNLRLEKYVTNTIFARENLNS